MESESDKRIAVSANIFSKLSSEVQNLRSKGPHFKVNESKLANAIIDLFLDEHLDKCRERLEKTFFDKRVYLKSLIANSASEEDLRSSINSFLRTSRASRKPRAVTDHSE